MNILIPMAGEGKRFKEAGYTFPKPLIEVRGKMMIEWALGCAPSLWTGRFIFLVRPGFPWKNVFSKLLHTNFDIIEVPETTEGALCTCLLAKELINDNNELLIINSDQYVVWDSRRFLNIMYYEQSDGGIILFKSAHPKWSYAAVDGKKITAVAEKNPISEWATCGIYYFKRGKDFVKAGEDMILANERFNGEFYVCPVYNNLIMQGMRIMPFPCESMHGLGTPEDLDAFNRNPSL